MSQSSSGTELFRLVSLRRAAVSSRPETPWVYRYQAHDRGLYTELAQARESTTRADYIAIAQQYLSSPSYIHRSDSLPVWLDRIEDRLVHGPDLPLDGEELREVLDDEPRRIVETDEYQQTTARLCNSLLASTVVGSNSKDESSRLIQLLKLCVLVEKAAAGASELPAPVSAQTALGRIQVVLPELALPPAEDVDRTSGDTKQESQTPPRTEHITKDNQTVILGEFKTAYNELSALRFSESVETDFDADNGPEPMDSATEQPDLKLKGGIAACTWSQAAYDKLTAETRRAMERIGLHRANSNLLIALRRLDQEIEELTPRVYTPRQPEPMIRLGGLLVNGEVLKRSLSQQTSESQPVRSTGLFPGPLPSPQFPMAAARSWYIGVGDLFKIEQILTGYELGEFAHVENVLAGERRERIHRRREETEEKETVEAELEKQVERDLESTDRYEFQEEVERSLKTEAEVEASLKLEGSYGPVVDFESSVKGSYGSKREQTRKETTKYVREVVSKSVEKVRKRVKTETLRVWQI